MNIRFEHLFPEGISDETAQVVSNLLYEIASQWENHFYHQIRQYQKQHEVGNRDPLQPWRKKVPE